jgi:hypothetical protein
MTTLNRSKAMGYEIEQIEYKGHRIVIEQDDNPQNPREEWDNLTKIHCCSSSYYLGEHNHNSWEECNEAIAEHKRNGALVFDVYAYIHSGTVLSLGNFHGRVPQGHAQFDSGKCGFIVVPKKGIMENWGKKNWTEALRKKAYEVAEQDIATFNEYLNNEVVGYIVDDDESCWGYYGGKQYAIDDAKSIVDYKVAEVKKSHLERVKIWIKNHVPFEARYSMKSALSIQF